MRKFFSAFVLAASSMSAGFAFGLDGVQEWVAISGVIQVISFWALLGAES